ncbi:18061_t:CDS:1, partial [Gigaspora rosea]
YTSKKFGILKMIIFGNLSDLIIWAFFSKGHSNIVHEMIIGNLVSTPLLLGAGH